LILLIGEFDQFVGLAVRGMIIMRRDFSRPEPAQKSRDMSASLTVKLG